MSLYDHLKDVPEKYWKYYSNIICLGYDDAIREPLNFIESNFCCGGKDEFLCKSLFKFEQKNNPEQKKRAIHVVNTFFLGLYLKQEIDYLKPKKNSFLTQTENSNNYLWAWLLCSLYHDSFYDIQEELFPYYGYTDYASNLLYNKNLIKRYFEKEKDSNASHNGKTNYDHGIVAAEKMFCNYKSMVDKLLEDKNKKFDDFLCGEDLEYCGLTINKSTFLSICKIAKIIACHNIFIFNISSDENEQDKYINLPELIKGNEKFRYMPNTIRRYGISSYEKLYFLLALVDTLEPSKRGIDLKEIDIQIDKIKYGVYDLHLTFLSNKGDQGKYLSGISKLSDWLNFVDVCKEEKNIRIDFNNNKNYPRIFG